MWLTRSKPGSELKVDSEPRANTRDPVLWLTLTLSGILIFWNLGGRILWQDESETALLARSIVRTGLPIAWDGKNLISQEMGKEFGTGFLWRWSGWPQFYLAAAAFELCGESEFTARLPFAILGVCVVPLTYLLAYRLFKSVSVARWSMVTLATSVPYLLHTRQARWYAVAYLLVVLMLLFHSGMAEGRRRAPLGYVLSTALLFYTNFFVAVGIGLVLAVAAPFYRWDKAFLRRVAYANIGALLLIFPGLLFFNSFGQGDPPDSGSVANWLAFYSGRLFTFLLPAPVVALLGCALAVDYPSARSQWRPGLRLLFLLTLAYPVYLSFGPWHMFRYLSVLLPLTSILVGLAVSSVFVRSRWAGSLFAAVLVFTNVLHIVPFGVFDAPGTWSNAGEVASIGRINSPLTAYVYEITHQIREPEAVICAYLNGHAQPRDVVLATYDDLVLQFYTRLEVHGSLQGGAGNVDADWIVARQEPDGEWWGGKQEALEQVLKSINPSRYQRIELPCPDFVLGNCPEPGFHRFRSSAKGPPVLLLHK
jgi:4-amino-4-deoxy-L-arabinose transferase-like glycosyltransferase